MKRLFIACLVVLLLAAAAAVGIEYDPGYVLLSYGHYTLETSVWIALAAVLLLVAALYLMVRFVHGLLRQGSAARRWLGNRRHRRGQRQTTRGLIAYVEGNWQSARRYLSRGAEESETPLLNYLMAARASHELGDDKQARIFLSRAERSTSGADIAVQLTQAEMQLDNGQLEESLATLTRARRDAARHPYVLKLLAQVYLGLGEWNQLLALLPDLRRHDVLNSDELASLERRAWSELLEEAGEKGGEADLTAVWRRLPRQLRREQELVTVYVRRLVALGDQAAAEKVLREYLSKHWPREWVVLYGKIEGADVGLQLKTAENWLRDRTNDAALLLTLGRLSLRNRFWGKAREYFENSFKLERSLEVCAELGRLLDSLGEHERSAGYFHEGLLLSTHELPPLPLPEKHRLHTKGQALTAAQ